MRGPRADLDLFSRASQSVVAQDFRGGDMPVADAVLGVDTQPGKADVRTSVWKALRSLPVSSAHRTTISKPCAVRTMTPLPCGSDAVLSALCVDGRSQYAYGSSLLREGAAFPVYAREAPQK